MIKTSKWWTDSNNGQRLINLEEISMVASKWKYTVFPADRIANPTGQVIAASSDEAYAAVKALIVEE